jgi:hypothetical protein
MRACPSACSPADELLKYACRARESQGNRIDN